MQSFRTHIERAIEIKGSQGKLADAMGCSQQYISWLLKEAEQISVEMALKAEQATSAAVSRHDLRPDIFGPAPTSPEQPAPAERAA
jgi:DNA-binding transcriptional regulator YdaS (Cro superfamily)